MGPYCKFCGQRCFTRMPAETPDNAVAEYKAACGGNLPIIATCRAGQDLEKAQTGYSYDDIKAILAKPAESIA